MKVLPKQEGPVNPLTHVHCDDGQAVFASTSVHCESNVHPMPTAAETNRGNNRGWGTTVVVY